jgi:hypothetical protein
MQEWNWQNQRKELYHSGNSALKRLATTKHGNFDVPEQLPSPKNGQRWLVFDNYRLVCPLDLS